MAELGKVETAKIPADQAINGNPAIIESKVYPGYDDITIRVHMMSEAEGMEGLICLKAIVDAIGLPTIIHVVRTLEKRPGLLQQAMAYLPLILK